MSLQNNCLSLHAIHLKKKAYMCLNSDCIFFFDEDDYYGCTDFYICDKCLSNNDIIEKILENYKMLHEF